MRARLGVVVCALLIAASQNSAKADVFRWDNGRLIPGTEGIVPQPGVRLDARQLRFADLADRDLHGSSFRIANLTFADLSESRLSGSDLTLANLSGAMLVDTDVSFSSLSLADLSDANLSGALFTGSSLARAKLKRANLTGAWFAGSDLAHADLSGAVIASASFLDSLGITPSQIYSTDSFQTRNLAGIKLTNPSDLDFAGQNLSGAQFVGDLSRVNFAGANLVNATFSRSASWYDVDTTAADFRGAEGVVEGGHNAILGSGQIDGLALSSGEMLVVRDYDGDPVRRTGPMPIAVRKEMTVHDGGRLRMEFDKDAWNSIIHFEPGTPVSLGGTLELDFVKGINATLLRGRTMRVFDWTGVRPQGGFEIESPYLWDLTGLYTNGEVRLTGAGLAGDYNGNRVVDQVDLDLVLQNWGVESIVPPVRWVNDYPSGPIDQSELDKVLTNWGRANPLTAGVPEPSTLVLLVSFVVVTGIAVVIVRAPWQRWLGHAD